jgi:hypothetical protein
VWIQVSIAVVILSPSSNYGSIKKIIYISLYRNSVIRNSLMHFIQQSRYTTSDSVNPLAVELDI